MAGCGEEEQVEDEEGGDAVVLRTKEKITDFGDVPGDCGNLNLQTFHLKFVPNQTF